MRATTLAVVALLSLAACGRRDDDGPPPKPPAAASLAERVRVLNADVLIIDGRHVRLAEAVTPQPIPQARCWSEALAAKQATMAARELVRTSHELRIVPTGKTDEYNRTIAHVFLDNLDLADMLHDAGFAAAAAPGKFSWCAPVSAGGEGAPNVKSLMDFSRG